MPATPRPPPARPIGRPLRPPPPPPAPRASMTSCEPPPRFQRMPSRCYAVAGPRSGLAIGRVADRRADGRFATAGEPLAIGRVLEVLGDRRVRAAREDPPQDPATGEHQHEDAEDDRQA